MTFVSAAAAAKEENEIVLHKQPVSDLFYFWFCSDSKENVTHRITHILPTVKCDDVSDEVLQRWYKRLICRIWMFRVTMKVRHVLKNASADENSCLKNYDAP